MNFDGQVVVVTGGARGIGFSTAMLAAQAGALTIVTDVDEAPVNAAVAAIRSAGGEVLGVVGDVSQLADVKRNAAQVLDAFGCIDVLVNNAAVQVTCPPERLSEEHNVLLVTGCRRQFDDSSVGRVNSQRRLWCGARGNAKQCVLRGG